nr:hepatitis A virus cellular receptor 2 homolog isoform X4 [Anas platyrhynchos]
MCWGRGPCPASKCSETLVWTDGWKVTYQSHSKYVLRGKLHAGDVSLTIINAKEADSGTYCCRVEIPGLFNDQLTNLQVVIKKAPGSASEASFAETWPSVSASETPQTNESIPVHSQQHSEGAVYISAGVCVVFLVVLVLGLLLIRRYLHNMKKMSNFASSVAFWKPKRADNQSALEVEIHAEENIYTIH